MQTQVSSFLLLLALVSHSLASQCQPSNSIDQLLSGYVSFSIPIMANNTQSVTYQTYNISFPIQSGRSNNLQYAFAISNMFAVTNDIRYFDLSILKTFQSHLILNFIYEPNKWSLISYNYWVSFRNDMEIGVQSFISDQIGTTNNSYQIANILNMNSVKESAKYAVMVFLNGIRFNSNNRTVDNHRLSFTILSQYLSYNSLMIEFACLQALPVYSLTLSYIVYVPEEVQFQSYGGVINQINFNSSSQKNLEYILPYSNFYALYGISAIVTDDKNNSFSFQSNMKNNFQFSYSVKDWEVLDAIEISYVIMGQAPSSLCQKNANCSSINKLFIHNRQCIQSCPSTSRIITYFDGGLECRQCPPNKYFSNNSQHCECLNGFVLDTKNHCVSSNLTSKTTSHANSAPIETLNSSIPSKVEQSVFNDSEECLKLIKLQSNNRNIYITLEASSSILSAANSLNKNFIKIAFADAATTATTYYCSKDNSNVKQYNCLLLYATGVPKIAFNINVKCAITAQEITKTCSVVVAYQPTIGIL